MQSDASLAGYKKHIVSKNADAPLTDAEMELKEMKRNEVFCVFLLFSNGSYNSIKPFILSIHPEIHSPFLFLFTVVSLIFIHRGIYRMFDVIVLIQQCNKQESTIQPSQL